MFLIPTLFHPCGLEQHQPTKRHAFQPLNEVNAMAAPSNQSKHTRKRVGFGYFSHYQKTLSEAKNPVYTVKTQCQTVLTPLSQPVGSYACGTVALATVFNAMQPHVTPLTSDELDGRIRRWRQYGLAPKLMIEEARRRGLFAQAYNHGSFDDVKNHLQAGHVVVVMHRARTQYHYELVQAVGKNQAGEKLLTLTDALEVSSEEKTSCNGFKTYGWDDFTRTCWQQLKVGVFSKRAKADEPEARNAYLNIPTGHDCYYVVFSTNNDLAAPGPTQKGPWTDGLAAWVNRWGNRLAKVFSAVLKSVGLKGLRLEWFGPTAVG